MLLNRPMANAMTTNIDFSRFDYGASYHIQGINVYLQK